MGRTYSTSPSRKAKKRGSVELNQNGEIIGIEITDATACVRDNILESAQRRFLRGTADS